MVVLCPHLRWKVRIFSRYITKVSLQMCAKENGILLTTKISNKETSLFDIIYADFSLLSLSKTTTTTASSLWSEKYTKASLNHLSLSNYLLRPNLTNFPILGKYHWRLTHFCWDLSFYFLHFFRINLSLLEKKLLNAKERTKFPLMFLKIGFLWITKPQITRPRFSSHLVQTAN